jgi:hypothetical protein
MVWPAVWRSAMRRRWLGSRGGGSAELLAVGPGLRNAFLASLADQAALELSNVAHNGYPQSAHVGGGVAPCFAQGDKGTVAIGYIVEDVA